MENRDTGRVESIDDPADPRLADYRELRDPSARRRIEGDEMFIAEGPTSIERLLDSGHRVRSVVLTPQKYERMRQRLEPLDAPVFCMERERLRDLVGFDLHRGAIAAADRRRPPTLDDVLGSTDRIAVLEGLNDPENLGAIARSARAFGVGALVLDPTCIDPYTRRTVRVSMGEVLFLPAHRASATAWPRSTFDHLRAAGFETWAMTPGPEATDIWDLAVPDRLAVVLGAEGPGLRAATLGEATGRVRLPIDPDVDSLNVGAAAAATFAIVARPR